MMESSIEHSDLWQVFAKNVPRRQNSLHVIRIVQRREIDAVLNSLEYAIID